MLLLAITRAERYNCVKSALIIFCKSATESYYYEDQHELCAFVVLDDDNIIIRGIVQKFKHLLCVHEANHWVKVHPLEDRISSAVLVSSHSRRHPLSLFLDNSFDFLFSQRDGSLRLSLDR